MLLKLLWLLHDLTAEGKLDCRADSQDLGHDTLLWP